MDYVSFGYIFMSLGFFYSAIECSLHITSFYSAIECSLPIASWFQIFLTFSRVEYLMLNCRSSTKLWFQILIKPTSTFLLSSVLYCCCSCVAPSDFRLEYCSTDYSLSVLFKGSASWCHITSTIPSCVEIRGRLCNVDAAWDAKSRHCDTGGIFSGETTITLPNLCDSLNHVAALMAEAIDVCLAIATAVYSTSDPWQFSLILYHSSSYWRMVDFSRNFSVSSLISITTCLTLMLSLVISFSETLMEWLMQ